MVGYIALETISIGKHPELSELWVQDRIAEDPALLGLGELRLKAYPFCSGLPQIWIVTAA